MAHLEDLLFEYLDWRGFVVKRNLKVGRREKGGWEMELDVVAFDPGAKAIFHYEPSLDAYRWDIREQRYTKKFGAGRRLIFSEVFTWLPPDTPLHQIAIFPSHPEGRDSIAGGVIQSVDEFVAEVRSRVMESGPAVRNAIPEQYPLLRTLQFTHCGYQRPR